MAYLREFIAGGFQNNGHGLDTNKIIRLMADGDRLVALTFSGANSRLIPLEDFRRGLANAGDALEPGPALLTEEP